MTTTSTEPTTVRYEFDYTIIGDAAAVPPVPDSPAMFALAGISEDVAQGIKTGLEGVASITDVAAAVVKEYKEVTPIIMGG